MQPLRVLHKSANYIQINNEDDEGMVKVGEGDDEQEDDEDDEDEEIDI